MEELYIRIPTSSLVWFENGDLISNPDFSTNMEVFRVGINENYNDIQRLQADLTNFAPITSLNGEAAARREADTLLGQRIDAVQASIPTLVSQLTNDANYTKKEYVDGINASIQGQLTALNNSVAGSLLPANIIAGSRVNTTVSGKNVTISVDVADIEARLNSLNAEKIPVTDNGNYFAGANVEAVLQEIGSTLNGVSAAVNTQSEVVA